MSTTPDATAAGIATDPRRGDWILTHCGRSFYPLDPRPEEVELQDIAHSLSQQCRWTGHVAHFYSIAQHAVYVAEVVEALLPHLALAALHHDSAEAYIGDMARPWKRMLAVRQLRRWPDGQERIGTLQSVDAAESVIQGAVFDALGIREPSAEEWRTVHLIDNRVLRTEYEQLMPQRLGAWDDLGDPIPGLVLRDWPPITAKAAFLGMHHRLVRGVAS